MARLKTLKPRIAMLQQMLGGIALDKPRGTSSQRGYTYRWQQYRKRWLREHPLCGDRLNGPSQEHSECARAGRVSVATDVDHVQRVHGPNDTLFWEPTNHQSLCHSCHSVKTQAEQTPGG